MLLDRLLEATSPPPAIASAEDWKQRFSPLLAAVEDPMELALTAGADCDRLGYAFACGQQAALRALAPGAPRVLLGFAATEAGGAHPRAIESAIGPDGLSGEKIFCTLGTLADEFLVLARRGTLGADPAALCVVRLLRDRPGIRVDPLPAPPFAPELPHARVRFENVLVEAGDILPGDGYSNYLRPLRTLEDVYVLAASLSHLLRVGQSLDFEPALLESILLLLTALQQLGRTPPDGRATHLALAGLLRAHDGLRTQIDVALGESEAGVRFRRDQGLWTIAAGARAKRRARAWGGH